MNLTRAFVRSLAVLCLGALPWLLGGCAYTLTLTRAPGIIHEGDTAVVSMALEHGNDKWQVQSQVTLTSDNPAAAGFAAPPPAPPSATNVVVVNTPNGTMPLGTANATVTAGRVDRDTEVTISGVWRFPPGSDPHSSVTLTVRPKTEESPRQSGKYIEVAPSVTPELVYVYDVAAMSSSGAPPSFVGCEVLCMPDVTVTVLEATNDSGNPVLVRANRVAGNKWYLTSPLPNINFRTVKVQVAAAGHPPTGLTMFTCIENGNRYVATVIGPRQ